MLRFYDHQQRRDYKRFEGYEPLYAPRNRFIPFEIVRTHAADDYVQTIELLDIDDNATDVFGYFHSRGTDIVTAWNNGGAPNDYDTFVSAGDSISTAVEAAAAADIWAYSNTMVFNFAAGDYFYFEGTLTVNAGTAPDIYLAAAASPGTPVSNVVTLSAGVNKITLRTTSTLTTAVLVARTNSGDAANYALSVAKTRPTVLPYPFEKTNKDYIIYEGGTLITLLPVGIYCLKITDNLGAYYSDYFCIQELFENLAITWSNDGINPYDAFLHTANIRVLAAIETSNNDGQCNSNTFTVIQGEEIVISATQHRTSGQIPVIGLYDNSDDSLIDSFSISDGDNGSLGKTSPPEQLGILTSDRAATVYLKISVTGNSQFALAPLSVLRQYNANYIRLLWLNSRDVRDVADRRDLDFSDALQQEVFLQAYLNTPIHESNEIGTEKDGVFIPEKLIATPRQRVVAYVPRSTYEGLIPLPLADTITIWDEVGIEYNVDAGNIEVNFDFTYFEIGTLELIFTESSYYWTENIDNIT